MRNALCVILSEAKNLYKSKHYKTKILRQEPQNDIVGQPVKKNGFNARYTFKP